MIPRYRNISLALATVGLITQIVGNLIAAANGEQVTGIAAIMLFPFFLFAGTMFLLFEPSYFFANIDIPIFMIGSVLLISAFVYYAKAKGRSGWFGLFGLVFPLGLLLFAVLKDESPGGARR